MPSGSKTTPSEGRIRRSERSAAYLPVLVRGLGGDGRSFEEETRTIVLSLYGALISLLTPVELERRIFLTNLATREEQECRVVHIGKKRGERTELAVEFVRPSPGFWRNARPSSGDA